MTGEGALATCRKCGRMVKPGDEGVVAIVPNLTLAIVPDEPNAVVGELATSYAHARHVPDGWRLA